MMTLSDPNHRSRLVKRLADDLAGRDWPAAFTLETVTVYDSTFNLERFSTDYEQAFRGLVDQVREGLEADVTKLSPGFRGGLPGQEFSGRDHISFRSG